MLCSQCIVLCVIVVLEPLHVPVVRGKTYTGTPMSVRLHPAIYNFDQLVTADMFVDKSMMIREFLESKCSVNVVTRPPKWGKSVNLEIIKRFFEVEVSTKGVQLNITERRYPTLFQGGQYILKENTSKILKPLKIVGDTDSMKQMSNIPVVMLRLASGKGNDFRAVEDKLKKEMKHAFSEHAYLKIYLEKDNNMLNSSEKAQLTKYFSNEQLTTQELENGLFYLIKLVYEHFKRKVIVLIDDKDTPLNHAVDNFGEFSSESQQVENLLQTIFKAVTDNQYIDKCLITGTLPFEDVLFQNASSICVSSVLDEKYSEHFGFSEFEVNDLVKKAFTPNTTPVLKMKYWYKGFHHGGKMVYNPYDILSFLSNNGRILDYWADSAKVKSLDEYLMMNEAQEDLQKLLEDEGTVKALSNNDDPSSKEEIFHIFFFELFYRLMVHHGYLNAFKLETKNDYLLRIPNQEVRNFFVDFKSQWFCEKHGILTNDLHDFVGCLVTNQMDQLKGNLAKVFENFKNVTLKEEKDYHNLMGQVLSRLLNHNYVFYNKHFELGRLYHMIVPRSRFQGQNAFVLEYRVLGDTSNSTDRERALQGLAQHTLQHIDSDVYGPVLTQYNYIDSVVTVAVAFWRTDLELAYKAFKQKI